MMQNCWLSYDCPATAEPFVLLLIDICIVILLVYMMFRVDDVW